MAGQHRSAMLNYFQQKRLLVRFSKVPIIQVHLFYSKKIGNRFSKPLLLILRVIVLIKKKRTRRTTRRANAA